MSNLSAKRAIVWIVGGVLFAACVWYVARSFQWAAIGRILLQTNLWLLICGCGVSILVYWVLRALRWYILLRKMGVKISLVSLYMCTAITVGLATLTPLRSGEILRTEFLKRYGLLDRAPGYGSFIIERIIDMVIVAGLAAFSVFRGLSISMNPVVVYTAAAGIVGAAIIALLVINKAGVRGKIGECMDAMKSCAGDAATITVVFLVSAISWAVVILGWQIALASLSLDPGFEKMTAIVSVITIIGLLSCIPGSLGVSEVGVTEFLMHFGNTAPQAQAGALVLRAYGLLTVLLSLVHLSVWKCVVKETKARLED
ncbi:MAG: lysylphosphatidylglycerol synthase transmembrane domain-containing protein [Armatimonadota bacterium]|jgi:uncharacterized membrane protein YbhN (UPF0104 family)